MATHFALFDRSEPILVQRGVLPHWFQPGATYFITFRTADSVPRSLLQNWHRQRDLWLERLGINPHLANWSVFLAQRPDAEAEFHEKFSRRFMDYLDRGEGACHLADPSIAAIVAENLRHSDGINYHLADFVVMPNHVHLIACLLGETRIEAQCRSWKRYTATAINRVLGLAGRFWQSESFDHLIRSPEQFEYLQHYIAENPTKARLRPGTYLHHRWTK